MREIRERREREEREERIQKGEERRERREESMRMGKERKVPEKKMFQNFISTTNVNSACPTNLIFKAIVIHSDHCVLQGCVNNFQMSAIPNPAYCIGKLH